MRRLFGFLAGMFVAASAAAVVFGPNLYVAGDGFTIEQAFADAASQRSALDSPSYKILVLDGQAARLEDARASRDVVNLLERIRASGGFVFVCGKDLKALGLKPGDLLPGVFAVRGFGPPPAAGAAEWDTRLPYAPDRKSLAICAID